MKNIILSIKEILLDQEKILKTLIIFTIIGFFGRLDYTQNQGCIIFGEDIFTSNNISFSITSLMFFLFGYFFKNLEIRKYLILSESIFWTSKLFFLKGGYATGFTGTPDIFVASFDIASMFLRLLLLTYLFNLKVQNSKIFLSTCIIITLKTVVFPDPIYQDYLTILENIQLREYKIEMVGNWEGEYYDENEQSKISAKIYEDSITFSKNKYLPKSYSFEMESKSFGYFISKDKEFKSFSIDKIDGSNFHIRIYDKNYKEVLIKLEKSSGS